MNCNKKTARRCCCKCLGTVKNKLIKMVADKLGEITVDPDNPLNLEEATKLVADFLDELIHPTDEYATDLDIIDLFNN